MLRHIALFRRKPEATAEDVSRIEAAFHQLPDKIPCIQSYRFGGDLGRRTYASHPEHQAVSYELVRPIMASREATSTPSSTRTEATCRRK